MRAFSIVLESLHFFGRRDHRCDTTKDSLGQALVAARLRAPGTKLKKTVYTATKKELKRQLLHFCWRLVEQAQCLPAALNSPALPGEETSAAVAPDAPEGGLAPQRERTQLEDVCEVLSTRFSCKILDAVRCPWRICAPNLCARQTGRFCRICAQAEFVRSDLLMCVMSLVALDQLFVQPPSSEHGNKRPRQGVLLRELLHGLLNIVKQSTCTNITGRMTGDEWFFSKGLRRHRNHNSLIHVHVPVPCQARRRPRSPQFSSRCTLKREVSASSPQTSCTPCTSGVVYRSHDSLSKVGSC